MNDFRKWLAGVLSEWADRLWPPYPERQRRGL